MLNRFLRRVAEPKAGFISPRRLSEALHIGLADLSRVAKLHRNTLANHPGSEKVQARLGEIARIIAMASDLVGDEGRAVLWFRHQPLSGFDFKTAEELVSEGQARAVLKHLEMLADGVYA
jgi:uncharacterized protein (DUF2384 family)